MKKIGILSAVVCVILLHFSVLYSGPVTAKVHVIIDKLPIDKQQKMKDFHEEVKSYIDQVEWLEEDDYVPIEISLQLFLTDSPSNYEDRYNCEFLISSTDVQYFDKRVRFPYQTGDQFVYSEQAVGPFTGVVNFYVNMVLGSELDKYRNFGGDLYYKRAESFAALGKFVRTEFIRGWTEREELVKRVFKEPFTTFRKMKDYYFYGMYIREKDIKDARDNIKTALLMLETAMEKKSEFDEPKQFLNAHYREMVDIFKDAKNHDEVFKKLIQLDPDHKELYEEYISSL